MIHCLVSRSFSIAASLHRVGSCGTLQPQPTAEINALSQKGFGYAVFASILEAAEVWNQVAPADNQYFNIPFLQAIEAYPPEGMEFRYLVFYRQGAPIGIAVCQLIRFDTRQQLNWLKENRQFPLKKWVARFFNFKMLVCGTVQATGEHGFYFPDPEPATSDLLLEALEKEAARLNVKAVLIKDVQPEQEGLGQKAAMAGYSTFCFQPNMVLKTADHWGAMEDYLEDLSAKYRVRYRRAQKKLAPLKRMELSLSQIQVLKTRIHNLYRQQAEKADFNLVSLHPEYWEGLKMALKGDFRVWAYFDRDEMVGFYTAIQHGEILEAHFLGYNEEQNREHQLYLNILYDLAQEAIECGAKKLVFARPALEIKSSIGARPEWLSCYIRHKNPLTNYLLPRLIRFLEPTSEWTPRNPFKAEEHRVE